MPGWVKILGDLFQKYKKIYLGEELCVNKLCNLFRPQPVFGLVAENLISSLQ